LTAWHDDGALAASRTYLVTDERAAPNQGNPRLISASLGRVTLVSWQSDDSFTVEASINLHLARGDGAWGDGPNDRFVTLTKPNESASRYLLELATGP
jgi:hypothetical protein